MGMITSYEEYLIKVTILIDLVDIPLTDRQTSIILDPLVEEVLIFEQKYYPVD